jgi:hypothetical protein
MKNKVYKLSKYKYYININFKDHDFENILKSNLSFMNKHKRNLFLIVIELKITLYNCRQ